jgi:hypothetical protein
LQVAVRVCAPTPLHTDDAEHAPQPP